MIRGLQIELDINMLDQDTYGTIQELCQQHPGRFPLMFALRDHEIGKVNLVASETSVMPNGAFIGKLQEMGLKFRL